MFIRADLYFVCPYNCRNQTGIAAVNFFTSGCIEHFDAFAFTTNQSGFAKNLEVLRKSGFRNLAVSNSQKRRAIFAAAFHDVGIDGHAHGVRKRMKDHFKGDLFDGGVDKRPHAASILVQKFSCSHVLNY